MADDREVAALLRAMADMLVTKAATRAGLPPELIPGAQAGVEKVSIAAAPKVKRKVSKYQREFGKQYKKLKKIHPKTAHKTLVKRAHKATKKVLK